MKTLLQVLSDDERDELHERTLRVLARTGMRVDSDEGRRLLSAAGAERRRGHRHRPFPARAGRRGAPPRAEDLHARRSPAGLGVPAQRRRHDARHGRRGHHGPRPPAPRSRARARTPTGSRRRGSSTPLDDVGVYWAMVDGCLEGESARDWVGYNIELARSFSKHVNDSFSRARVGAVAAGDPRSALRRPRRGRAAAPVLVPAHARCRRSSSSAAAPTRWLALRGWDIPVLALPMPMMGTTAPGSLLATTLLANCETLGVLCFVQAAEPGTPVRLRAHRAHDGRAQRPYAGTTAHAAIGVAGVEMARYYGLAGDGLGAAAPTPSCPASRPATRRRSARCSGSLAWPDLMVGPGCLGGATVLSHAQLLIDVEMFRMAPRGARRHRRRRRAAG